MPRCRRAFGLRLFPIGAPPDFVCVASFGGCRIGQVVDDVAQGARRIASRPRAAQQLNHLDPALFEPRDDWLPRSVRGTSTATV